VNTKESRRFQQTAGHGSGRNWPETARFPRRDRV